MIVDLSSAGRLRQIRNRLEQLAAVDTVAKAHLPVVPPFEKREILGVKGGFEIYQVIFSEARAEFDARHTDTQRSSCENQPLRVAIDKVQDRDKSPSSPCPLCEQLILFGRWFGPEQRGLLDIHGTHQLIHKRFRIFNDEFLLISNDCRPATRTTSEDTLAMVDLAKEVDMDLYFSSMFGGASQPHHWHCQVSPQPFTALSRGKFVTCILNKNIDLYLGSMVGLRFALDDPSMPEIIDRLTSAIDRALPRVKKTAHDLTSIEVPGSPGEYPMPWPGYNLIIHREHLYFLPRKAEYVSVKNAPGVGDVRYRVGGMELGAIFSVGSADAFRAFSCFHCKETLGLTCITSRGEVEQLVEWMRRWID